MLTVAILVTAVTGLVHLVPFFTHLESIASFCRTMDQAESGGVLLCPFKNIEVSEFSQQVDDYWFPGITGRPPVMALLEYGYIKRHSGPVYAALRKDFVSRDFFSSHSGT